MISLKGLAAGLVALLSADAVIASPCKVSLSTTSTHALSSSVPIYTETISSSVAVDLTTTTIETSFPTSFTETASTAIESSDVSSTTESAATTEATSVAVDLTTTTIQTTFPASVTETASTAIESSDVPSTTEPASTTESAATTEATTSADATSADATNADATSTDATTTTEAISTSTEIASTTEQLPPVLPTIANADFDDGSNGRPWMGTSSVSNSAVYWKRSAPNVMIMRPGRYIAQEIVGLRTDLTYRIRFYWVKFDDPRATAGCKVMASFGGSSLGEVALLPPSTPNDAFEEFYSTPFQPSTTSAEFRIEHTCSSTGQTNRFYIDDVSIEFA